VPELMEVRGCARWLARSALAALLPLLAAAPLLANQNVDEVTTDQDLPHREVGYIPATDPNVRSMLATQLSSASRFGTAQIDNVGAHIKMLHLGQDPCSLQFDVGTNIRWERAATDADAPKAPASSALPEPRWQGKERGRCGNPLAFWIGGNVELGSLRPSSAPDRSDFATSGLTAGADAKVVPRLALGVALGYGRDSSDADLNGSEGRAQAKNATFYALYEPVRSVYVDFLRGYGNLDDDSTRWQDSALMAGARNGSQSYGSLAVSGVIGVGKLKLAPYGRVERLNSRLDGYVESGSNASALGYGQLSALQDVVAGGLFASTRILLRRASLEPSVRIEARRVSASLVDQASWYADTPADAYVLVDGGVTESQVMGGVGLVARVSEAFSLDLDYSYTGASGIYRTESIRATLRAPF
jgi:outer membrane autotransporter protein